MKTKKTALIISILILLLFLVCTVWSLHLYYSDSGQPRYVVVYQNHTAVTRINLQSIRQPYVFTVTGSNGCTNTVQIKNNSISIIAADCPNHSCIRTGTISRTSIPLVCLPNHLMIQLESNDSSAKFSHSDYDTLAY